MKKMGLTLLFMFSLCFSSNQSYAFKWSSFFDEAVDFTKKVFRKSTDEAPDILKRWPQIRNTKIGKIIFRNPITKGRFGERLTAKRLTGMGFIKIKSKYDSLHGIDGVYIKINKGKIDEIIIAESKVDGAILNVGPPKQMSDEWIIDRCHKLLSSGDPDAKQTARLVLDTMQDNPNIIKKQLWKHDLESGKTIVHNLDNKANISNRAYSWDDKLIENELRAWCEKGRLECVKS